MSLGDMYEKGEGVSRIQEKSLLHHMLAADRRDPDAQLKVAMMFEEGYGTGLHPERVMYLKLSV